MLPWTRVLRMNSATFMPMKKQISAASSVLPKMGWTRSSKQGTNCSISSHSLRREKKRAARGPFPAARQHRKRVPPYIRIFGTNLSVRKSSSGISFSRPALIQRPARRAGYARKVGSTLFRMETLWSFCIVRFHDITCAVVNDGGAVAELLELCDGKKERKNEKKVNSFGTGRVGRFP